MQTTFLNQLLILRFCTLVIVAVGCSSDTGAPIPSTPTATNPSPSIGKKTDDDTLRAAIDQYFKTPYDQRFKYTVDGEQLRATMAKYYADRSAENLKLPTTIRIDSIRHVTKSSAIAEVFLSTQDIPDTYVQCYARKQKEVWLVDWSATNGWNLMRLNVFQATMPSDITTFRVLARIGHYYNYQYRNAQKTHYSIHLSDNYPGSITGYAEKDTSTGASLFSILKDGEVHKIVVSIGFTGKENSLVGISKLVSDTWFIDE